MHTDKICCVYNWECFSGIMVFHNQPSKKRSGRTINRSGFSENALFYSTPTNCMGTYAFVQFFMYLNKSVSIKDQYMVAVEQQKLYIRQRYRLMPCFVSV